MEQLKFIQPEVNSKRYVLRLLLKVCKFGISRSSHGRGFQSITWAQPPAGRTYRLVSPYL